MGRLGCCGAVLRNAPTVILRPAMGVSKAVGQTLMGATNSLDPGNRRRTEDVSRICADFQVAFTDLLIEIQEILSFRDTLLAFTGEGLGLAVA